MALMPWRGHVEALRYRSSSYRQNFTFGAAGGSRLAASNRHRSNWRIIMCIRFTWTKSVALLAAVGEGTQGRAGPPAGSHRNSACMQRDAIAQRVERVDDRRGRAAGRSRIAVKAVHEWFGVRPPVPVLPSR